MKPTSEVRREAFAAGYQDALRDVRRIWDDEGAQAALDYIDNNLARAYFGHFVPPQDA